MKTTPEIEEEIKTKQAELDKLVSDHNVMVAEFQQNCAKNQQRGSFLEGHIAALKSMIAETKQAENGEAHAAG